MSSKPKKAAPKNAGALIDREAREAAAAGATRRTKVGAVHRTTNVVSLHLLTDTLMRWSTRPIASAITLRKRLGGLITGSTIKRMLSRADHRWTRRGIRLRWVVLLLAGHHHHHRTSTRRGQASLLVLLFRRRRRRPHQPRKQYRRRQVTDHHHRACQTHQTAAVPQGTLLRGIRRLSGDRTRGCE